MNKEPELQGETPFCKDLSGQLAKKTGCFFCFTLPSE
jgi:hypothetical protein